MSAMIPNVLGADFEFHVNSSGYLIRNTYGQSPRTILVNNHIMSTGNVVGECAAALGPNGDLLVSSVQASTGGARFYRYVWGDGVWYDGNGNVVVGA